MRKIEYVWRDLLDRVIEEGRTDFTISHIAEKFKLSTSVVHHAIRPLRELHIVRIEKRSSEVLDWERLLFFWATRRNMRNDIIYSTYSSLPLFDRESLMPSNVIPTAYTAFRLLYKKIPADYDTIYFYSNEINCIQERFPFKKGRQANIFIIKPDPYLIAARQICSSQLFTDLWNLKEWYAKDFQDELLLEIKKRLKQ